MSFSYTGSMIGYIEGEILAVDDRGVIVNVSGVGYMVYVGGDVLFSSNVGEVVKLWTEMVVRENQISLFGFKNKEELVMFNLLLDVSGIGPRSALSIVGLGSVSSLASAIKNDRVDYLTKVSGIGKKSAQKIVIELKDKMAKMDIGEGDSAPLDVEVMQALEVMGYKEGEIRKIIKEIPQEVVGTNNRIRAALALLSKN